MAEAEVDLVLGRLGNTNGQTTLARVASTTYLHWLWLNYNYGL